MNTRLVWNFEITNNHLLNLNDLINDSPDEVRWEARYFWPSEAIVCLDGLDQRFLALSNYEAKHRQDSYILLADAHFNLKYRRQQLSYKPLLKEAEGLKGYGKKINLDDYPADLILPASKGLKAVDLFKQVEKNSQKIEVAKEALIYKFPTNPTIKLELARLEINQQAYFSLCVEGRSQILVTTLARHLLRAGVSCDYVSFLKQSVVL